MSDKVIDEMMRIATGNQTDAVTFEQFWRATTTGLDIQENQTNKDADPNPFALKS